MPNRLSPPEIECLAHDLAVAQAKIERAKDNLRTIARDYVFKHYPERPTLIKEDSIDVCHVSRCRCILSTEPGYIPGYLANCVYESRYMVTITFEIWKSHDIDNTEFETVYAKINPVTLNPYVDSSNWGQLSN